MAISRCLTRPTSSNWTSLRWASSAILPLCAIGAFAQLKCRGWVPPWQEAVHEYVVTITRSATTKGLGNVIPILDAKTVNKDGKVAWRQRLGGLLNYSHRQAA
jgi:hypothetical protein